VILFDGTIYKMWYSGWDGTTVQIGYALSGDGVTWERQPTPVLTLGAQGSWDDESLTVSSVLYVNGVYHMWYSGQHNRRFWAIGYATSSDGIHWTKHPQNPVLTPGQTNEWDDWAVAGANVSYENGTFKMWYTGIYHEQLDAFNWRNEFGYATSSDGVRWTKYAGNPVIRAFPTEFGISFPRVIRDGNLYKAWYGQLRIGASGGEIGYAVSSDGINWTRLGIPVLTPGQTVWGARSVGMGDIIKDNTTGTWRMWYFGYGGSSNTWSIGLATTR
jgi:predicted GH43/DUF377 family glycosyl hydrolase